MTAADITEYLYRHFENYEYKLNNTFVFDWESDFFARSKSGYYVECEVKISRSDYFKDFEKDKHKIFADVRSGKTISVYKRDAWFERGDVLIRGFVEPRITLDRRPVDTRKELIEWAYRKRWVNAGELFDGRHVVNDWDFNRIHIEKKDAKDIYAPATAIGYHKLEAVTLPHQFYYVVPEGLVKLTEVPSYAGLLHVRHHNCLDVVKRAPYLHKRPLDLTKTLLKKYYNLWTYKVPYEVKQKIRGNISET